MHAIFCGMKRSLISLSSLLSLLIAFGSASAQDSPAPTSAGLSGDIGMAVFSQNNVIQGNSRSTQVLPYAYFDYDRFFARIDTFGFKTLPIGYGSLEVVGRYDAEGSTPKGTAYSQFNQRDIPVPIGVGTLQITPIGAFFVYAFNDFSASKGKMAELTYAAEFDLPHAIKIYPLVGFDYKDKRYLNYFYGVSPLESHLSGINAYSPSDGVSPFAAAVLEVPVWDHWVMNTFIKQKWLSSTIVNSPLVNERRLDNVFISLSYRFE